MLSLLSMVGSIVALWENKKTTRLLDGQYQSSDFKNYLANYRRLSQEESEALEYEEQQKHEHKKRIMHVQAAELVHQARLAVEREQEVYRVRTESKLRQADTRMHEARWLEEESQALRALFYDSISLSQRVLDTLREKEEQNRPKINELEHELMRTGELIKRSFDNIL